MSTDIAGELIHDHNDYNTGSLSKACGWHFVVLMSRQGKIRLSEFFSSYSDNEKRRLLRDIAGDILPWAPKMCNIIEKGTYKFVCCCYASLYFVAGVPLGINELIVLEQIHLFVEALDGYFNSVRELDLVFSLHKSLLILFEMFIGWDVM
jgi:AP-1 complex subunit sigma 1/2